MEDIDNITILKLHEETITSFDKQLITRTPTVAAVCIADKIDTGDTHCYYGSTYCWECSTSAGGLGCSGNSSENCVPFA
jgi:hypothetical protein